MSEAEYYGRRKRHTTFKYHDFRGGVWEMMGLGDYGFGILENSSIRRTGTILHGEIVYSSINQPTAGIQSQIVVNI